MRSKAWKTRQRGGTAFAHLYRTARWQGIRRAQLAQEPLCAYCLAQGNTKLATVCDHVNGHPVGETEQGFWVGPFQSLCASCHNGAKQEQERHGTLRGGTTDGWPLDQNHHWNRSESVKDSIDDQSIPTPGLKVRV